MGHLLNMMLILDELIEKCSKIFKINRLLSYPIAMDYSTCFHRHKTYKYVPDDVCYIHSALSALCMIARLEPPARNDRSWRPPGRDRRRRRLDTRVGGRKRPRTDKSKRRGHTREQTTSELNISKSH